MSGLMGGLCGGRAGQILLLGLGLAGCKTDGKETGAPLDTAGSDAWHVLLTGQGPFKGAGFPGVWEVDADLSERWRVDLPTSQGAFGALRRGEQTLYARTGQPPNSDPSIELADPDGTVRWAYDSAMNGGLTFPHGVGVTQRGGYVNADVMDSRIFSVQPTGEVEWEVETFSTFQSPTGMTIGLIGGEEILLSTVVLEPPDGSPPTDQLKAWRIGPAGPELIWEWPTGSDPTEAVWLHGPHILDDGTILVSAAGLGRIVHLDAQGNKIAQYPADDRQILSFPRDAIFLPDGRLLVVDSVEILIIDDPAGDFTVTSAIPAPFSYGVDLLDCRAGECL